MEHHAVVAQRPGRAVLDLLTDDAVLHAQAVMGEFVLVEEMAELAVEFVPFVVGDHERTVFDAEGVSVVFAQFVPAELGCPAVQVLAVE